MIVTCPTCNSKYRVRDEAVPPEGAELQCPSCSALFVAHPPRVDTEQVTAALETVTRARDVAEQRLADVERRLGDAERRSVEAERRLADAERRSVDAERRLTDAERRSAESDRRLVDTERRGADAERRSADLERQLATAVEQARRLTDDLAHARGEAADGAAARQALFEAQKKQKTTAAELDVANALIGTLQSEVNGLRSAANPAALTQASQKVTTLQAELAQARDELERLRRAPASSGTPPELAGLIAAVGPMLWGLEQALVYLEQFSGSEPVLAGHVKQLRLLQKVLTRLAESK